MLQYRHRKFGHIVDVDEPADVLRKAEAQAAELTKIGTKRAKRDAEGIGEYAEWQANRQRQTLARMDESQKWERYTPPVTAPAPVVPAVVSVPPVVESAEAKQPVKRTAAKVDE